MNILFTAWAGYDFLALSGNIIISGTPEVEAKSGYDDGTGEVALREHIKIKEIFPSVAGKAFPKQVGPTIVKKELRPYPWPRNS